MFRRRELTPEDVREAVFGSIGLILEAQRVLNLPICPNIEKTKEILSRGKFRTRHLPRVRLGWYQMAFGAFEPPSTIILDSRIPFCDRPLHIPELPETLLSYTATHEVIHADDHVGGDVLFNETREHIMSDHGDKLDRGLEFIGSGACSDHIRSHEDLACLWSMQYVDMVTHYRAYVATRQRGLSKLDLIWGLMLDGYFPPNLLTTIERERDTRYIFDSIIGQVGRYCLIDALMESLRIGYKVSCKYTV